MTRAVLSIGSNLGDRLANLRLVTARLGTRLLASSGVFETAPWGVTDQPAFLNAVLIAEEGTASARDWLELGRECEAEAQRVRRRRWGPRSLDVDVITVDEQRSADPELTLPHPRAQLRGFVLLPWLAADPDANLPGHGPVAELAAALSETERSGVLVRADLELP
ncbi:2-amino-4-hydroxy-6-hydroxymethyldihydropteridine diphosphokinase [Sciscionella marina]|uniref:2-amino-4-hydroxy-6- hydroxymethyldihydropteridine diphosphokinase n=1 Tax=Sciscionella marina TaxID=508770 RepID=UPI00035CB5B9|nr:2-amino-4-hydroxy-6-hydroxymethyldihydropteridine diphosphokinase [Sciscionella marina]